MKSQTKIDLFIIALVALVVVLAVSPAWASGGDDIDIDTDTVVGVETIVNGGDMIGGDNNFSAGGSRSFALAAPPLADVDIAQCLGSTSWSFLIGAKQKLVLNHVCMAEFYLKQGRYDLAAQELCNQPEILEEYDTETVCEIDQDLTPAIIEGEDKYDHDVHSRSDDFEATYAITQQQQEEELEYMREEQATLVAQVNDLKAYIERPRPAPVQQQAELFSEERMQSVLNAYLGVKEDDDGEE